MSSPATVPDRSNLITLEQAAERYPVTVRSLRRYVQQRDLPHWRFAGRVYLDPEEIDAYFRERNYTPAVR